MRILFQGDSITDAGRDKRNYRDMGFGYPKYTAELLNEEFPELGIDFINFGISGNRSCQLSDRLYMDAIQFQPDIISILIGINDIWHRYDEYTKIATTDEQFATNYRAILERLKRETNAKIVMICPYVLDHEKVQHMRGDLERFLPIIHTLRDEFADAYIPLDELFAEAIKTQPQPHYYSGDGVHPNENGARFIAKHYFDAVAPLVRDLTK